MSRLPRRLIAVASLCCLIGGLAFFDTVRDSYSGRGFNINGAVVFLPIGIGLFKCKLSSRRWATFWAGMIVAVYVAAGIFVVVAGGEFARFDMFGLQLRGGDATVATWVTIAATIMISVGAVWVLYTPPVSGLFVKAEPREPGSSATDESPALPV